jgi:hypothetical protein
MIARSALPFSARNILDRVCRSVIWAQLHHYARLLFRGDEPQFASALRRAGCDGGKGLSRWQQMFAACGEWSSVLDLACHGEARPRHRTERFRHFCRDCEEETAHEEFDEFGPGWYAQICRCRRCGREGMRIWPLACW